METTGSHSELEGRIAALAAELDELRPLAEMYRTVLASVLDPTITIDDSGTILAASGSVASVFGYDPQELVGGNIKGLMPEPHRSQHDGYLETYRRTGHAGILGRTREFQVVRKDGVEIDVELSVSRADVEGRGPVFTGSFRDITSRRRAEEALRESERRLQAIFDQSFQAMAILDPDGGIVEVNRALCEATGHTPEDLVGQAIWGTAWWAHGATAQEAIEDAVGRAKDGDVVHCRHSLLGKNGETLQYDLSIKAVVDEVGEVEHLIFEGRDITELERAQRAETAMLRGLASIGESAAVLAHEIKNPITGIQSALRAVAQSLDTNHRAVLDDLLDRLRRLERSMHRTLSFAKPVEIEVGRIDVDALLDDVTRGIEPALEEANVRLEVDVPDDLPQIDGDIDLLGEVVGNLLHNAAEACVEESEEPSLVRLCARRVDGGVEVRVDDDGPGVAESRRETIFKPFQTTKTKGTGLGLPFCRKVVDAHQGDITVEVSPLGGAAFVLRLPERGGV